VADKPNILFIFTDDQSYNTVHALGNEEIITPNLDRLVNEGTSFTNAYNMGAWAGAVCVASRTMMNTGRSVWRSHALDDKNSAAELAKAGKTWSQLLKSAGYETYMSGKWHVKLDPEQIFDHVRNVRPGMPNQTPEGYGRPIEGQPDKWSPYDPKFEGFWKGGKHWSEVLADDAELFMEQASGSDKPFFMYIAFNAPHDPRQAPKEFVDLYPLDKVKVPTSYQPSYPYKQEIGCYMMEKQGEWVPQRDENLAPHPRTEYAIKVNRQEYYACVTHLDAQIGRILAALEKTGKMDNTYIFMSSDHGLAVGSHGLLGKQNMYEHSMKPPMIVVGPSVPKAEQRDAFVYLQDIMASALDVAGVEKPAYVEFNSLMPLIRDARAPSNYSALYGCFRKDLQRMVRVGDHKLIVYPGADVIRLYDVGKDPLELEDIAGNPENKALIRKLFMRLLKLQEQMDDPLDLTETFPELAAG
jgi:arylsulfatase A-like enzyme